MNNLLRYPSIYFVIALVISLIITPVARVIAMKLGVVDKPNYRKIHTEPTPYFGGISIYIALLIASLFAFRNLFTIEPLSPIFLFSAITLIFIIGIIDDLFQLPPAVKMTSIGVSATILYLGGYSVEFTSWHFINYPLTLFWFLGITNAANLMDNMNGLASGCGIISALFMAWLAWMRHDPLLMALSLAMAGAYFGFLRYNFPQAKIFLGDTGSVLLGFSLATLGLTVGRHTDISMTLAPILLVGLFVFDTFFVAFSRWARKIYFWEGGLDHTSHRFVMLGFSKTKSVMLVWLLNVIFGINAVIVWRSSAPYTILLCVVFLALGIAFWRWLDRIHT